MGNKTTNTKVLVAIFGVILFGLIGGTVAYYNSSNSFLNEFNAGKYKIKTEEVFESPDNWTPGDTTPKEVTVKNEGTIDAAVKVCFEEKWEDANGNSLSLIDDEKRSIAILNLDSDYDNYWKKACNDNCYYYYTSLKPNEETEALLESVTYNPDTKMGLDMNCVTDSVTHTKTCTSESNGYSGGKYTLKINIETIQYDQLVEAWDPYYASHIPGETCFRHMDFFASQNVLIESRKYGEGEPMFYEEYENEGFNVLESNGRYNVEKLIFVDNLDIPNNAIISYDVSFLRDNSVMTWFLDADNDGLYERYIGANGGVIANPNSSYLFSGYNNLSEIDVSHLDVSRVINMSYMFEQFQCHDDSCVLDLSFISDWNVSHVTNMCGMFADATLSNFGDLSNWDTSSVTDMSYMFKGAYATPTFDISTISNWDVSNVTNMAFMFAGSGSYATTFNIGDLSNWDTGNVTNMKSMFQSAAAHATNFNISFISGWDVSKVTNMSNMFDGAGNSATTWNVGNLNNWNTSNVTDMYCMFYNAAYKATTFDRGNIGGWNVSKVTNMGRMFYNSGLYSSTWSIGNLSNWNTSSVTIMDSMFSNAGFNATTWNSIGTLKVYATNIMNMFKMCANAKGTLNIYSTPTAYNNIFVGTSTKQGSGITVNYSSATTNIDNIIATKSNNSNVVKGAQLN